MRFVVAATGSRGDVQPALVLAQALQRAGHAVRVGAPADFARQAAALGLEFQAICGPFEAMMQRTGGNIGALIRTLQDITAQQLAVLPWLAQGADLMVGATAVFGARSVAEALGIPYRFLAYCSRTLPSPHHPTGFFPGTHAPRWFNRLLWRLNDVSIGRAAGRVVGEYRARRGLPPVRSVYRHTMGERALLPVDPLLDAAPPDRAAATDQVGAFFLEDAQPLPPEVEAFLAAGEPPVYIGFGSMVDADPNGTTHMLVRAVTRLGLRAVVSRGWAGLGQGPLPRGVLAIGPVSHAALLPRLRAMVHHGGAGTVHAALRAGIPQVVVPHLYDQFYWGPRTQALGVAPAPIPRKRLTAARLEEALRWCLTPGAQQRARAVAPQVRTDGTQRAVELLTAAAEAPRRHAWARAA